MNVDTELEAWTREWQSKPPAPVASELRRTISKQTRYMRIMLAGDVLVTVVMGGGVVRWAVASRSPEVAVLATATWIFIAAAWIFALLNHRRSWRPSAQTTAAFVELSLERCRGRLRAVKFGAILYITEMIFCLTWIYRYNAQRHSLQVLQFLGSTTVIAVILLTVLFAVLLRAYRRKKVAELAWLQDLQRQMTESYH